MNMRVEEWCGHKIRFVEHDNDWWAILKDVCKALDLKTWKVAERLDPSTVTRIRINTCDIPSREVTSRARKTQDMLVVNELGIYEALFASRKLEARKFRLWSANVLKRLRGFVGLQSYEALKLTDEDIQDQIDSILDVLYWDDERKELMVSVTVAGGDVDQVPFDEYLSK